MARFTISKHHTMSIDEVREAAEQLAQELKSAHGLRYRWSGDTATFNRSGIDGKLQIDEGEITLSVKLGMLASAFERPLKQAIQDYLDQYVS